MTLTQALPTAPWQRKARTTQPTPTRPQPTPHIATLSISIANDPPNTPNYSRYHSGDVQKGPHSETIGSMGPSLPSPCYPSPRSTNAVGENFYLSLVRHQHASEMCRIAHFSLKMTENNRKLKSRPHSERNGGMRKPIAYHNIGTPRRLFAPVEKCSKSLTAEV